MSNHRRIPKTLPLDIKHYDWINLVRKLQSIAAQNNGLAIIRVTVLVDGNGKPIQWVEPEITKVEPWRRAVEFLDLLTRQADVT